MTPRLRESETERKRSMAALAVLANQEQGYGLIPIRANEKKAAGKWGDAEPMELRAAEKHLEAGGNIALRCGNGLVMIDVDPPDLSEIPPWLRDSLEERPTWTEQTPRGGRHFYFASAEDWKNHNSKLAPHVDVKSRGGYVLVAPSQIDGKPYQWLEGCAPHEVKLARIPEHLEARLRMLKADKTPKPKTPSSNGNTHAQDKPDRLLQATVEKLRSATEGTRNETLNQCAFTLAGKDYDDGEIVSALFTAAIEVGLEEGESRETIKSGITGGRANPLPDRDVERIRATGERVKGIFGESVHYKSSGVETQHILKAKRLTDLANAERLKSIHGRDLLHHSKMGWFVWDGRRWSGEAEKKAEYRCREVAQMIRDEAALQSEVEVARTYFGWAKQSACANGIQNMLRVAATLPEIDADAIELDSDPWLFNCQNGTVDLRTLQFREHRRGDHITKIAPVVFDPKATCPTWLEHLRLVFDGDQSCIDYFQWVCGYALTGSNKWQCFFILHGPRATGKSTTVETLSALLGDDYAQALDGEAIMQQKQARHSCEIASLRGARMVTTIETGEGRRLNENMIKQMTGSDRISARFMRMNSFTFMPSHKLFMATNHKPVIRDDSGGMFRRIRLIPFEVDMLKARDPDMPERLKAELPGILNWALVGAQQSYTEEAAIPAVVKAATADYEAHSDPLREFIASCCDVRPGLWVPKSVFFDAYLNWSGDRTMTQRLLAGKMAGLGYEELRTNAERKWRGLTLSDTN